MYHAWTLEVKIYRTHFNNITFIVPETVAYARGKSFDDADFL